MKKHLLSFAAAAAIAMPFNASAQATLTTEWFYMAPELNEGWDPAACNWDSADEIKAKMCPRFATARNGVVYIINMKTMSIAQITADGIKDLYKLPPLEDPTDNYGPAISSDDAGNFLIGHYFTKPELSSNNWSIYSPATGKIKHFDLGYPDAMSPSDYTSPGYGSGAGIGRIDCVGRVLGDLTNESVFFIAPPGGTAAQNIRIVYGFGSGDVDDVDLDANEYFPTYLGSSSYSNIVQPAIDDIDIFSLADPGEAHYRTCIINSTEGGKWDIVTSYWGTPTATACNNVQAAMRANPNAKSNGFDSFVLDGKRYFVHAYTDAPLEHNSKPMDIAVWNELGEIVAKWATSEYASTNGYNSIIAEPQANGTALIHVYVSTTTNSLKSDMATGCGAAAVIRFTPDSNSLGSKGNPIMIETANDLLTLSSQIYGDELYVELANDIDFTGIPYNVPLVESQVASGIQIHFNGNNHVLKNITVKSGNASVFGSYSGTIRNLGVENITASNGWFCVAGIVGSAAGNMEVDNCYVTGDITGAASGGIVGAILPKGNLTVTNCYSWANVTDVYNQKAAGLVGRAQAPVTIENCYAAGAVSSATGYASGIVNAFDGAAVKLNNVIAWNPSVTGVEAAQAVTNATNSTANNVLVFEGMKVNGTAVENGTDAQTLAKVATGWDAYNSQVAALNNLPVLAWQDPATSAITDVAVEEATDAPAVYYNLQGIRVANPANGIYLVRRGNKVEKVLVK